MEKNIYSVLFVFIVIGLLYSLWQGGVDNFLRGLFLLFLVGNHLKLIEIQEQISKDHKKMVDKLNELRYNLDKEIN